MTKRILTGVDGSDTALAAARKAAELAVSLGGELRVISAYGKFEAERVQLGGEEFYFSTEQDALTVASDVVTALRPDFPGLQMVAAAASGKPGEALVEEAERVKADLIVVGNKRVQGPARVLGSVARDVAVRASCDVYIANTRAKK
ncbi:universal stress protein [Nocardioides sp. GXZ039]|uniref:universal stress protein n=1 Tax=Nocardioides sp. GXZ039 TaxID=3136018 RepID=UPI0030F37E11